MRNPSATLQVRWSLCRYLDGPAHALFTTDSLETFNEADDQGYEKATTPYTNINTGARTAERAHAWFCVVQFPVR
jgi:hypothetical protein